MNRPKTVGVSSGALRDVYFDYSAMVDMSACNVYVLDETTVYMALQLIKTYGHWPNRFVFEQETDVWEGLIGDEVNIAQTMVECAEEQLQVAISSTDDIGNAIRYLGDRLAEKDCCEAPSSGNAGASEATPSDEDVSEGVFPDEFASLAEYQAYKCDWAHHILATLDADLVRVETLNWLIMSVGSLAGTLLTPIPGDELVVLASILTAFLAGGGTNSQLTQWMRDTIANDYDAHICAMVDADNAAAAKTALSDTFSQQAQIEAGDVGYWPTYQVMLFMLNYDFINNLFDRNLELEIPSGNECDCATQVSYDVQFTDVGGTLMGTGDLTMNGQSRVLTSVFDSVSQGNYRVRLSVDGIVSGCNPENNNYRITVHSHDHALSSFDWFNGRSCPGSVIEFDQPGSGNDLVLGTEYVIDQLTIGHSSPFTVTVSIDIEA